MGSIAIYSQERLIKLHVRLEIQVLKYHMNNRLELQMGIAFSALP